MFEVYAALSMGAGCCNIPQCSKLSAHPLHHLLSLSHAHPQCPSVFMFLYHFLSLQHTLLPLSSVLHYSLTLSSPLHCLHNTTLSCSHAHDEQKIHAHIALHTPPNVATRTIHLCRPKINQLVNKPSRKTGCTCSVMNRLPIAHGLVGADLPECFN